MGRPPLYDWNGMFRRIANELSVLFERDKHYSVPDKSFRSSILAEARRRDIRVRTTSTPRGLLVTLVKQAAYPWDYWMDGQEHILIEGQDFTIDIDDMRRSARRVAKARGLHLISETNAARTMLKIRTSTEAPPRTKRRSSAQKWREVGDRAIATSNAAELARRQAEDEEMAAYDAYLESQLDSNMLES